MIRHWIRKQYGIPLVMNYAKKIEQSAYEPYYYQQEALKKMIKTSKKTEFGVQSGLSKIKTTEEARQLPVFNYELLRPEFEKLYQKGKKGFFSSEKIKAIGMTSGTTGGAKYLPITQSLINNFIRTGVSLYAGLSKQLSNKNELFDGKALYLSALPHVHDSPTSLPVGFISGYMNSQRHWLYQDLVYPSTKTLQIADTEIRISQIFEEIKNQDIRAIVGFPAIIQLMTEKALSCFHINHLQQLWKNLSICIYGGNFISQSQINYLRERWFGEDEKDKKLILLEHYSAVEGFFGHTLYSDWPGLVFNPFDIFYQFKADRNDSGFLQLHELEEGKRYFIYVTTLSGLVNYEMEDIIEVTSIKPLTFLFFARAKEQISLISEKIIVSEIKYAVDCLAKTIGMHLNDFAVYLDNNHGNQLSFILSSIIPEPNKAAILLDNKIREINPVYNEYRTNHTYQLPQIIYKSPEFFSHYREKNIHKGNFKEKRLFMSATDFNTEYGAPVSN